jgi:hypothetical protein
MSCPLFSGAAPDGRNTHRNIEASTGLKEHFDAHNASIFVTPVAFSLSSFALLRSTVQRRAAGDVVLRVHLSHVPCVLANPHPLPQH